MGAKGRRFLPMTDQFRKECGAKGDSGKEDEVSFSESKDVDEFTTNCINYFTKNQGLSQTEKRDLFEDAFPDEFSLLKSFDRAFWLLEMKSLENMIYVSGHNSDTCPFAPVLDGTFNGCLQDDRSILEALYSPNIYN